jgi:hypothetical protein
MKTAKTNTPVASRVASPDPRRLEGLVLKSGKHEPPPEGARPECCVMEAVAWVAGEPHSDYPDCACPIIREPVVMLNDSMTDEERQQLLPLVIRLVGSRDPDERKAFEIGLKRAFLFVDTYVRKTLPAIWEAIGMAEEAVAMRALEEISSEDSARRSRAAVQKIYDESKYLRALSALRDLRALRALRALMIKTAIEAVMKALEIGE